LKTTLALALLTVVPVLAVGCGASPTARRRAELEADTTTTGTTTSGSVAMSGPPAALEVSQPATEVVGSDGVNIAVRSRIRITNPNPYPVTLRVLDGIVWLDGVQAATARVEGQDVLEARTDRVFQLDVSVPAQLIMSARTRTYVTSGTITAIAPDGTAFASPFSFEGPLPGY